MTVGDFVKKKKYTKNSALQSWLPFVRISICVVTTSTLFYNHGQTSSLSFASTPLERSEILLQSKIKVHEILSHPRDIWEIVFCFDVILSFS